MLSQSNIDLTTQLTMDKPPRSVIHYNEQGFLDLMNKILTTGEKDENDRTGVGTRFSFGETVIYEMYGKKIPAMTSRFVNFEVVLDELLMFLKGNTDTNKLKSKIWFGNTTPEFLEGRGLDYEQGDMGPMYGWQWRHAGAEYIDAKTDYTGQGFDQIQSLLDGLVNNPSGRRHMVTAYIPQDLDKSVLAPCHVLFQYCYETWEGKKYLSCTMYQRSADLALAAMSFNVLSYSILLHMICAHLREKGIEVWPGKIVHMMGNAHVYLNHHTNAAEQVTRVPLESPTLELTGDFSDLAKVTEDQFEVIGYKHHGKLRYKMAV